MNRKTKWFFSMVLVLCLDLHAQENQPNNLPGSAQVENNTSLGIHFQKGSSLQQLLQKAKKENKYLFVDCYATWCHPCRYMNDSVFSKKETAEYMNKAFINVKVQMDQTVGDDEWIKNWYKDAEALMKKFEVAAFPTFLFLAPDGELVYKAVGVFETPAALINKAAKALDPEEQYFFLLEEYNRGKKDQAFLERLIQLALKTGDASMAEKLKQAQSPKQINQ